MNNFFVFMKMSKFGQMSKYRHIGLILSISMSPAQIECDTDIFNIIGGGKSIVARNKLATQSELRNAYTTRIPALSDLISQMADKFSINANTISTQNQQTHDELSCTMKSPNSDNH